MRERESDDGMREGRAAFVRVAMWIRRSRGRTVKDRCEGGRCFCPTSNTFSGWKRTRGALSLGTATRRTLLGARARMHDPRIQARTSRRVGTEREAAGGEREQENRRKKRERER